MKDSKDIYVLAVVHARGGSKRVPLKNIRPLLGKPLVAHITEAAVQARFVNRVIVSTDHEMIKEAALAAGADVPFMRPADISEDVPSELVTQHAVNFHEKETGRRVDIAVTLQPTTPFCTAEDVDGCIKKLLETGAESVVTMCEVRERPEWMFALKEGDRAVNIMSSEMRGDWGVVQSLPKLYVPNGGIYATIRETLMEKNAIYGADTRAYVMPPERSVDIDEEVDFPIAEAIYEKLIKDK